MARKYAKPVEYRAAERMGRPPALSRKEEWELYCYRKAGVSIKTCASFFQVSVPTTNRIIAKFREYDDRVEPTCREFRALLSGLVDAARVDDARSEVARG